MSDIVERLRSYASDDHERLCQGRYYSCSCGYDDKRDPLMTEAAAKIERLRAALEDVSSTFDDTYSPHSREGRLGRLARAALAQEKP